jgi:hypothetical protein
MFIKNFCQKGSGRKPPPKIILPKLICMIVSRSPLQQPRLEEVCVTRHHPQSRDVIAGKAANQFGLTWDRCYDFLNIFAEKFSEKIGVFDSKQS